MVDHQDHVTCVRISYLPSLARNQYSDLRNIVKKMCFSNDDDEVFDAFILFCVLMLLLCEIATVIFLVYVPTYNNSC